MKSNALFAAASAFVMIAALGACSQSAEPEGQQKAEPASAPDAKPGLSVADGRLVLPAVAGNPAAAYFSLTNGGKNPVELAAVYITGSGGTEIHDTSAGEMNLAEHVSLAPGETVQFAPGGKHVMVFDLLDSVTAGGTAEMTLTFADGDKLSTPLSVETVAGNDPQEQVH